MRRFDFLRLGVKCLTFWGLQILTFGGYKFLRLGLDFLRLGLTNPYVWGLDFLRLEVTNSYVLRLDFLRFEGLQILTFRGCKILRLGVTNS